VKKAARTNLVGMKDLGVERAGTIQKLLHLPPFKPSTQWKSEKLQ